MAEPGTSTLSGAALLALVAASAGPVLGEYALVIVCSFLGALVHVTTTPPSTRTAGAAILLRGVVFGFAFTGLIAKGATAVTGMPASDLVAPAAVLIGYRVDWVIQVVKNRLGINSTTKEGTPDA